MKWGIQFANMGPFSDPDLGALLARTAEEAGFESLSGCEHVVIPVDYSPNYPFAQDGKLPETDFGSADSIMPDPITWMGFISAITTRINLTTGVVILPQRNPVVLAKQLLTLDQLSKGRISIGIGVGWLREEYDAINVPWERRGKRCDEYIQAMRALWYDDVSTFEGEFVHFRNVRMIPQPAGKTGIPIVVGGHGDAAAQRAGRLGDGFFPAIFPNSELWERLPGLLATMRQAAVDAGRDPASIEVTSGGTRSLDGIKRFEDLGVGRLVIRARSREPQELRDELLRFGDEVIAKS